MVSLFCALMPLKGRVYKSIHSYDALEDHIHIIHSDDALEDHIQIIPSF